MRERTKQEVLDYLRSIGCRPEADDKGNETGRYTIPRNSRIGLKWIGAVSYHKIPIVSPAEQ